MRKATAILATVAAALVCTPAAASAQAIFPAPLTTPVWVDLVATPVVTVGPRTIDFTPNLGQEFINFLFLTTPIDDAGVFRFTIGVRARDGLAALESDFPTPPLPGFPNVVPSFTPGTTDLGLFDVVVGGFGTPFGFTITDVNGDRRVVGFATPVPEPSTWLMLGTGLLALGGVAVRRRKLVA